MNTGTEAPTIHQAAVELAREKRKADPKLSMPETFEAVQEAFPPKYGLRYDSAYRTFLNHYYSKRA
ncbi:hypothetical protein [Spirosoma sp. 209]|uniref:hypothetical protein n=1 Tax=Spirosoma sp. 209 TaxID=1955701 RepID=UPI00098D6723|nr:hypothetical protein [Spirosoma sp. 209]